MDYSNMVGEMVVKHSYPVECNERRSLKELKKKLGKGVKRGEVVYLCYHSLSDKMVEKIEEMGYHTHTHYDVTQIMKK